MRLILYAVKKSWQKIFWNRWSLLGFRLLKIKIWGQVETFPILKESSLLPSAVIAAQGCGEKGKLFSVFTPRISQNNRKFLSPKVKSSRPANHMTAFLQNMSSLWLGNTTNKGIFYGFGPKNTDQTNKTQKQQCLSLAWTLFHVSFTQVLLKYETKHKP